MTLPPDAREARLRAIAGDRPAQAVELRELLAALPDPEIGPSGSRTPSEADGYAGEPAIGTSIGGCVLRSVLGRGGVGTVYEADQIDPPRRVAVKVIRAHGSRRSHVRRFRTEIAALARLEHPAIARIHASGVAHFGTEELPYLVMERVEDPVSFVAWARRPGRTVREVVERLVEVAEGMQHGHARGVMHRDLKPSNVLVGADGHPKIIDFGIARILDGDAGTGDETLAGALVGTPSYMAPEQLAPGSSPPDVRIDVHALGLILYEALSGRRAYEIPRERHFEAAALMRDADPPALERIDSGIGRDLSSVVAKAMAKDAARRYATMAEFAEDLRATLEGRSVRARRESRIERSLRWMRRNPAWTLAASVVLVTLVAGSLVTTLAWRRAAHELALAQLARAAAAAEGSEIRESLALVEAAGIDADPRLVGFVTEPVDDATSFVVKDGGGGHRMSGTLSPDRRHWIAGGDGLEVQLVDLTTGAVLRRRVPESAGFVWSSAFAPDGSGVFLGSVDGVRKLGYDGSISDVHMNLMGQLRGIIPLPGGERLLLFPVSAELAIVDLRERTERVAIGLKPGNAIGLARWDGARRVYAACADGLLRAFDLDESGNPTLDAAFAPPRLRGNGVATAPDRSTVAFGAGGGEVLVLDSATGEVRQQFLVRHAVWGLDYSPDGRMLFVGDRGGRIHRLHLDGSGTVETQTTRDTDPIWALGAIDGERVIANLGSKLVRFDFSPAWSTTPQRFPERRLLAASDFDGRKLRAVGPSGIVRELDLATGRWTDIGATPAAAVEPEISSPFGSAAFSKDGEAVALWDGARFLVRKLTEPEGPRFELGTTDLDLFGSIAWSGDSSMVALATEQGILFFSSDGRLVARSPQVGAQPLSLNWIDARSVCITVQMRGVNGFVATCPADADATAAPAAATLEPFEAPNVILARLEDRWVGPVLNGEVRVWKPGPASAVRTGLGDSVSLAGHTDVARTFALSPDRTLLASGGADGRIRFWSLERNELQLTLRATDRSIAGIRWSPDGAAVLVHDVTGGVRCFDSVARRERMARTAAELARSE